MSDHSTSHRNRLAGEASPYLRQHAGNPVDWYPWGDEPFERARREDRPVLLSVGYASCHWCHVMARESFEDPEIAALMNEGFVSIKVDREERPDIDAVYMTATQALTGQGGWPMTVFLTPEREPFFAGTYFPPRDAYGRPGFRNVLQQVRHAWDEDRERVMASAGHITQRLREATEARAPASGAAVLAPSAADEAVQRLRQAFDLTWGGFGAPPKFPVPGTLEFLLAHHARTGDTGDTAAEPSARGMVLHTLRRMAAGGIRDHLGGGFARYSVDERWLVPHFEQMLYDNAQLARVYLHAMQLATEARDRAAFERVVRGILDFLLRDMLDASGGFASARDADSEGIEGRYFVWTPGEIEAVLGAEEAALFTRAYGVTAEGNFADPHHPGFGRRSVLSLPRDLAELAPDLGLSLDELEARLERMRRRLLEARSQRVPPALDDQVLASWNGLALAAFAEAGRVLRDERYLDAARRLAAFVDRELWRDGRLFHAFRAGVARVDGMLEDYASIGLGLVELFQATGNLAHLQRAVACLQALLDRFHDEDRGGFFDTAADGEALLLRQRSSLDAAVPSGNGAAARLAFALGRYFDRPDWEAVAEEVVASVGDLPLRAPSGFGAIWLTVEALLAPPREVAIVGPAAERAVLEEELGRHFLPHAVIAPADTPAGLPVLEGREVIDGAAAFVCEQMVCRLPVTTPEALREELLRALIPRPDASEGRPGPAPG